MSIFDNSDFSGASAQGVSSGTLRPSRDSLYGAVEARAGQHWVPVTAVISSFPM